MVTNLQAVTRAVRLVHGPLQHQRFIVVVPRVVRVLASAPRARRHLRVTARGEVTKCDGNHRLVNRRGGRPKSSTTYIRSRRRDDEKRIANLSGYQRRPRRVRRAFEPAHPLPA